MEEGPVQAKDLRITDDGISSVQVWEPGVAMSVFANTSFSSSYSGVSEWAVAVVEA